MPGKRARRGKGVWLLALVPAGSLLSSAAGYADQCMYVGAMHNPEKFVTDAVDFVFEAKVRAQWTTIEHLSGHEPRLSRVEVIMEVLSIEKGELAIGSMVRVVGTEMECECVKEFQIDRAYRIVASASKSQNDSSLRLHYCDFIKELEQAGEDAVPESRSLELESSSRFASRLGSEGATLVPNA